MALSDEVEACIISTVGPVIGQGLINGCYRHIGISRDELNRDNIDQFIKTLETSLPLFVGEQAASGVIEKIKLIL